MLKQHIGIKINPISNFIVRYLLSLIIKFSEQRFILCQIRNSSANSFIPMDRYKELANSQSIIIATNRIYHLNPIYEYLL